MTNLKYALFQIPSEAQTVIEIYTNTTTHLPILTFLLVTPGPPTKSLGFSLEKSAFHRLIPNNSFIC
ncbi:hypothetical protein EB796_014635 [Bugula neritina]|uniref:Uncharacterized protein n=1 Tax=Bugula neritina TaxID=10212 RepID=A0A7J7JL36_BUGNE|nr:hypothetical protein EB796_014635 [Bugula neritina]